MSEFDYSDWTDKQQQMLFNKSTGGLRVCIEKMPWFPFDGDFYRALIEINGEKHYLHPFDTLEKCLSDLKTNLDTMLELNRLKSREFSVWLIKQILGEFYDERAKESYT